MFKQIDDPSYAGQMQSTGRKSNDPLDRLESSVTTQVKRMNSDLDDAAHTNLYRTLMGHYRRELMRQEENRMQQSIDVDFYDNLQWTAEDANTLLERGQHPLTFNVIATAINWMLGTEKRGRTDYRILPRKKEGAKSAERKTQIMKYVADANRQEFHISQAFGDAIKAGVGWLETGVQSDDDGEPIYARRETWRNMLWDSMAQEMDLSDGRYQFRTKWMDTDIAMSMFEDRKAQVKAAESTTMDFMQSLSVTGDEAMDAIEQAYEGAYLSDPDGSGGERGRVRVIEAWFRVPVEDQYISGGQFAGELYDGRSQGHVQEVLMGRSEVIRKVRMRMHVAIMTEKGLLYLKKSPYRHNRFPFTPIWCNRRDSDNMPYGVVRSMRDPQSDLNKRASKALYILSTNKTIMDEGAVADLDEFREEAARPDAVIVKKRGHELTMGVDRDLAPAHLDLMSRSISMIQQISGITDENMGRTTNATSGKAIIARQDQGSLATAGIFDNLRFARQIMGEKQLSLIEQFITEEKEFRITNMRGSPDYITVNDGLPENDIVRAKADYIISEDDFNSTIRQAQVDQLVEFMMQVAPTAPGIIEATLDILVETMDIPMQDELVKRIRALTGAEDPDADPNNPDPETIERNKMKEAQAELQMRGAVAEVEEREASAAEKKAKATKAQVEAEKIGAEVARILALTSNSNVDTQLRALEAAAQIMAGRQGTERIADSILQSSGFVAGQNPYEAHKEHEAQAKQQMQQQMQQEQAMQEEQAMAEAQAMQQGDMPVDEGMME